MNEQESTLEKGLSLVRELRALKNALEEEMGRNHAGTIGQYS